MLKILAVSLAVWAPMPPAEIRPAAPGFHVGIHAAAAKHVKKPRAKKPGRKRRAPVQQEYLIPPDDSELLLPPRLDPPPPYIPGKRLPFPRACASDLDCAMGSSCDPIANRCR
jgi:hypothetical protein